MTDEQKAALVFSQAVAAFIECEGMKAENQHRINCGNSVAYGEDSFTECARRHGVGFNPTMQLYRE